MKKSQKLEQLAQTIVNYSLNIEKDSNVLITFPIAAKDLVEKLILEIAKKEANSYLEIYNPELRGLINQNLRESRVDVIKRQKELDVENYQAFINIRYNYNDYEEKNALKTIQRKIKKATHIADEKRVNEREWVLLNYPTNLDAYRNKMSYEEFYNYAFDVMNIDYQKMSEDIIPLKELMEKTDKVRIVSPNTDLTFSIKNLPAVPCTGEKNIPDGELYTAPVKNSVNGTITYNTPSPYDGYVFNNVSLTFKDGKIIKATSAEHNDKLNEIFNVDEGSSYVGEFSFGFNPMILHPIGDILYDEKILGSIHFTPGNCYDDCNNGNKSAIHWDMVLIQRKDYGGGEIYFDDVLIRKDGMFVLDELKQLNYNYEKVDE